MKQLGIITLTSSETKHELNNYIDTLNANSYQLLELTEANFENEISKVDILLIDSEKSLDESKVCKWIIQIREKTDALLWIIQHTQDEFSRIIYLQLGADRIITNSYSAKEFKLALDNSLKRLDIYHSAVKKAELVPEKRDTNSATISLDGRSRSIWINEIATALTVVEYQVMELLCSKQGMVFSYEEIQNAIWENVTVVGKFRVSNIIFRIRKKLSDHPVNMNCIQTVRSKGYRIIS